MKDYKLIPDKETFDITKTIMVMTSERFLNYTEDLFYTNREEYFYQHPEKSEISFLKDELKFFEQEMSIIKKQKTLLLWNIERFYSEDDLDNEYDFWQNIDNTMLRNIDFIKQKIVTENGLNVQVKIEDLFLEQNELTPGISIEEVYNHFKVLIEPTDKGTYYLSYEQLYLFIKSTFIDKQPVKQNFKYIKYKKDVRRIFRAFLDKYEKREKGNTTLIKQKYFDIMDKGFYGFNITDYKEFHR
ncbi:hypothetical protein [Aequorivita marina]|uniref:hypothetical protein n=1 Tax=Aequorivita marina TaxID=3073654 RepID=UPI002877116E|nr:hypothetical protein [Aequorivita sp. S2608]MDS1297736.1 hypothetical protein [Aequorivita sp. S2608]